MATAEHNSLPAFLDSLGKKDPYTREHSERVGDLMEKFAVAMKLPASHIMQMKVAGLIHDAGKLDTPNEILGRISRGESIPAAEKKALEAHVESESRLATLGFIPMTVKLAVRHHHERWDGTGFPDKLAGGAIPPSARMLTVCDVYDAVCSDRPGKKGVGPRKASKMLKKSSGTSLDPKLAQIFIDKIASPEIKPNLLERFIRKLKNLFKRNK